MAGILKCDQVQSDSNLSFQVAGANVAYMNSTGLQMTGGQIIAGSNTLITSSGLIYANAGIAFPATPVPSADANTLDDYEEGTFTPSLGGTGSNPSSVTYGTRSGVYTKIGNTVTIWIRMSVSSFSGGSGSATVTGLPFTTSSSMIGQAVGAAYNATDFPVSTVSAAIELPASSAHIYWSLYTIDNGSFNNVALTALGASAEVRTIFQYQTA